MLAALIWVRCRFPSESHPNTKWIIDVFQKYLAGKGNHKRICINTRTKEHSHADRSITFSLSTEP